jgi:hypothetical protein
METNWNRCIVVLTSLLLTSAAQAAHPIITDVLRDGLGHPRSLSQNGAAWYCAHHGAHLPSAREYAEYAANLGAAGIRETAYPGISTDDPRVKAEAEAMSKDHYIQIYTEDYLADGAPTVVGFYYSAAGFHDPAGTERWLATSSVEPDTNEAAYEGSAGGQDYFWSFNGATGVLDVLEIPRNLPIQAVRCAK